MIEQFQMGKQKPDSQYLATLRILALAPITNEISLLNSLAQIWREEIEFEFINFNLIGFTTRLLSANFRKSENSN